MAQEDVTAIEAAARKKGATANTVIEEMEKSREKKGLPPFSESAVRRVLRGEAYQRAKVERRGRPRKVTKKVVQAFENTRKKLAKKMKKKGGGGVPWKLIMSAGKLRGKVSIRRLQPVVKETEDVTYRPDRARPERTENETEAREHQSGTWKPYPVNHWLPDDTVKDPQEGIHGYIDNKTYYVPTTPAKKAHLQKLKVHGHLRKKSEGSNPEYLKPKRQHRGIGCPSITIAACVEPRSGKIIAWLPQKKWNGAAAKEFYENGLRKALERAHGKLEFYRIVEDGDPTGYQSNLGKAGKRAAKIRSWQLPPRTPEWMPFDYSLWDAIEKKALKLAGKKESKKSYAEKLKKAARGLSVNYVKSTIGAMRKRICATFEAKGEHIKID